MNSGVDGLRAYYGASLEDDRRRRDLIDGVMADMRATLQTGGVEPDLARSYEVLAAERMLLDALIRNSERMLRIAAEVEAANG
jgi:hypothetical protein